MSDQYTIQKFKSDWEGSLVRSDIQRKVCIDLSLYLPPLPGQRTSGWPNTQAQLGWVHCMLARRNITVLHWGSTPWQEGTRVETANVRIQLSSYTRDPQPGKTDTYQINIRPRGNKDYQSLFKKAWQQESTIEHIRQMALAGALWGTKKVPWACSLTRPTSVPRHGRIGRGREVTVIFDSQCCSCCHNFANLYSPSFSSPQPSFLFHLQTTSPFSASRSMRWCNLLLI